MIINSTTMAATRTNLRAMAIQGLLASPIVSWFRQLFMVIQSNTPTETFHFLKGAPQMREWYGDRKIKGISEASFSISVKKWESTIEVLREDLMYDKLGQVRAAIGRLSLAYPAHLMSYLTSLLLGGFTTNGYDGQYFFDTDHPNYNGGTWSNKSTALLDATSFQTARNAPSRIQAVDDGRYFGNRYDFLVYGPNSQAAVENLFVPTTLANGATNLYYNQIPENRRVMLPELGNTGKWFLFTTTDTIKPFILQIVRNLEFIALDNPTDWTYFNRETLVYGLSSMDNASYGLPELAYGSTNGE